MYFGINYFLSDIPEILYQKDYKFLCYHLLAFFFYYVAIYYVSKNLYKYALNNLVLMELGSSMLSIDLVFKNRLIIAIKHNIFLLSIVLSVINNYFLCLELNSFLLIFLLSFLLLF